MGKFLFDILASALLLVVLSPVFLIIAICLKFRHAGVPVIIPHHLLGKDRKPFRMWKFSTMVANASEVLEDVLRKDPKLREEWETTFKLKDDPRILPGIGHFLRRTSLNELPQLANVLCGEMSLVGPRPFNEKEEALYLKYSGLELLKLRYTVRPGITGLWQVNGRNDTVYEERIILDRQYLTARSWWTDLYILLRTFKILARPSGAY